MYKKTLHRIVSWQLLAAILASVIISGFGQLILDSPVLADTPTPPKNEATWFYKPEDCSRANTGRANAALAYTYSSGKTIVFDCAYIVKTSDQDYMQLQGPSPCNNNPGPTMKVGQDSRDIHQTTNVPLASSEQGFLTTYANISPNGQCTGGSLGPVPITLTNTYAEGSKQPNLTAGTATWQKENPAELKATYTLTLTDGINYSQTNEIFDEADTANSGTSSALVLTSQNQAAPNTSCPSNEIDYSDATQTTATIVISLWGYEGGSDLHCYTVTGTLTLDRSYQDAGGTITSVTAGTEGQPCPVNDPWLGWILCPIYGLAKNAIQTLNDSINGILFFDTNLFFGGNSGFQESYNIFRNIGLSLLVIAGLVMVVSQAAGLDIFSAYTIRKMLPRVVIAAIGISLAWPLLQIAITFFNDTGGWISDIILVAAPKVSGSGTYTGIGGFMSNILVSGAAITFAFAKGWTIMGFLSLVFSVALGLLLGYVVLVIRLMVVIVCIIMAPLAIAASVIPGTERLWKFWKETLLGALLMYPIVMAFLSAGAAMAAVASTLAKSVSGTESLILDLIAVISYFIPYFLIPIAFRMASGLMGNVFGMINDRSKGIFDGLRKGRQERRKQTVQDAESGNRFKVGGFASWATRGRWDNFANAVNPRLQTGYLATKEPFSRGKRNALRTVMNTGHIMEALEKDPDVGLIKNNEDYWEAGTYGDGSERAVRQYLSTYKGKSGRELDDMVGAVMNVKRKYGNHAFRMMAPIAIAGTGTGFVQTYIDPATGRIEPKKDANGNNIGDVAKMDTMIAEVAEGDKATAAQIFAAARARAGQVGRVDIAGSGFGSHLMQIYGAMDAMQNGNQAAIDVDKLLLDAFRSSDTVTLGRARANALSPIVDVVEKRINDINSRLRSGATVSRDEELELGRLSAELENLRRSSLMYAAPERVEVIAAAHKGTTTPRTQVRGDVINTPTTINSVTGKVNPAPQGLGQTDGWTEQHALGVQNPYNPSNPQNPVP